MKCSDVLKHSVVVFCFLQTAPEVVNLSTCMECGIGIKSPISEEQVIKHMAALLQDVDMSTAKRFIHVFTVPTYDNNDYLSMDMLREEEIIICPHCVSMQCIDWLSSYELPLHFWMSVMALPSIAQPFVLRVRQFADARSFQKVYVKALQALDTTSGIPNTYSNKVFA